MANGYPAHIALPHLVQPYYNYPYGAHNLPPYYNPHGGFERRKQLHAKLHLEMHDAWNYEDPENYLIDSYMTGVVDGRIKQIGKQQQQPRPTPSSPPTRITTTTTPKNLKTPVKITLLPFYGGAKGQTLQITEFMDGTVNTEVLQGHEGQLPPVEPAEEEEEEEIVLNPVVPVRRESEYGQNIKNIHRSALNIIRLQETAKNKGLNEQEEAAYKEYMDSLNQSAHNLAKIYEGDDDDVDPHNRAGLSGWFARKKTTKKENKDKDKDKDKDKKKEEEDKKKQGATTDEDKKKEEEAKKKAEEAKKKAEEAKKKAEAEAKKKEEEEKKRKEEEKKKLQQEQQQVTEADEETHPAQPPETSVAEAKPVGLAVAGIGGVASSKPVATAVVGPGGLAIARPVGTAIAGVSPDQALVPIYAEGFVVPKPASNNKKPTHSTDYLNKIISKYHQV